MRTSSEARILNVVEVVLDRTPGTTTEALVGWVAFRQIRTFWKGIAVGDDSGGMRISGFWVDMEVEMLTGISNVSSIRPQKRHMLQRGERGRRKC